MPSQLLLQIEHYHLNRKVKFKRKKLTEEYVPLAAMSISTFFRKSYPGGPPPTKKWSKNHECLRKFEIMIIQPFQMMYSFQTI